MSKKYKGITKKGSIWYIDKVISKKRINRSLDTGDEAVAIQRAKALVTAMKDDKWALIQNSSNYRCDSYAKIDQVIESFKAYAKHQNLAETSVKSYIKRLSMVLRLGQDNDSIETLSSSSLSEGLVKRFKHNYVDSRMDEENQTARQSVLRSANTILRDARSIFTKDACCWYADNGLKLPELKGFRDTPSFKVDAKHYILPPESLRSITVDEGRKLKQTSPHMYLVFLMAYELGMRASEIMNAKLSWIVRGQSGRPEMQIINRPGFRPKWGRERCIPMSKSVYNDIKEAVLNRDHIIPGKCETKRRDLVWSRFSKWMRSIGWTKEQYPKAAHELRKLIGSEWYSNPSIGPAAAQEWLGHMSMNTTSKFYARLAIDVAPIER